MANHPMGNARDRTTYRLVARLRGIPREQSRRGCLKSQTRADQEHGLSQRQVPLPKGLEAAPGFEPARQGQLEADPGLPQGPGSRLVGP